MAKISQELYDLLVQYEFIEDVGALRCVLELCREINSKRYEEDSVDDLIDEICAIW